jgi:hypothetical protein
MIKENTNIKVGWFMKKYNKFQVRLGKFDDKSKEWITSKGDKCIIFFDTYRNRYTTAVNYFINEV